MKLFFYEWIYIFSHLFYFDTKTLFIYLYMMLMYRWNLCLCRFKHRLIKKTYYIVNCNNVCYTHSVLGIWYFCLFSYDLILRLVNGFPLISGCLLVWTFTHLFNYLSTTFTCSLMTLSSPHTFPEFVYLIQVQQLCLIAYRFLSSL